MSPVWEVGAPRIQKDLSEDASQGGLVARLKLTDSVALVTGASRGLGNTVSTEPVTFLFTEIEGGDRLLRQFGERHAEVLAEYRRLLRVVTFNQGGREVDSQGGRCCFAFSSGRAGLSAAVTAMRVLGRHQWPAGISLPVRMGLHAHGPASGSREYGGMGLEQAHDICAAGHRGQILLSQATRDLVANDLPQDVSLRDLGWHRLKDLAGAQRLFQVDARDLPRDFPPVNSLETRPNNLPIQPTRYIGRRQEQEEIERLLPETRLLTLTGAGGVGKTRLALQAAAAVVEHYPDGVWLVDLAELRDPRLVLHAVLSTLGVSEQPNRSLTDSLVDYLRHRALLLVLDTCEQVLHGCAQLADTLLRGCPNLRILATSREALRIGAETAWRVPSLAVPDVQRLPPPEQLARYDAVRLFVERAKAILPRFAVTNQNADAIARVCNQLDGIPLGIELAAAQVKVLAVEQIAERLSDRFRLLTAGSRTALPRHQTLRAAMDWSHELLSDREKILLRRLAVFRGGWTLAAAEAICPLDGFPVGEVLQLLAQLVDKSLVLADTEHPEARYSLLETVAHYGRERLAAVGEAIHVRRRHRDWYLQLAEQAERELRGPNEEARLGTLEAEHDNLRAALEFSLAEADGAEAALRFAAALYWFWYVRGHWSEGRGWLDRALSRSREAPASILPKAFHAAALLARRQGDHDVATRFVEQGLPLSQEFGDTRHTAWFLIHHGITALHNGDYQGARRFLESALALNRQLGDLWYIGSVLMHLGHVARAEGDSAGAVAVITESLELYRRVGDRTSEAHLLLHLGRTALDQKDAPQAAGHFAQGLTLARGMRTKRLIAECLGGLAQVAQAEGKFEKCARLLGAQEGMARSLGLYRLPLDQASLDACAAATRTALGDAAFAAATAEGRAMTVEAATGLALGSPEDAPPRLKRQDRVRTGSEADPLTARQREIATLVARGLTNREIAAQLVVSQRTAESHIQNILNRLGFTSRAQLAAWAAEHGLGTPFRD